MNKSEVRLSLSLPLVALMFHTFSLCAVSEPQEQRDAQEWGQRTVISDIPWDGRRLEEEGKVIYGEDDRIDVYEESDPARLSWAAATCALVSASDLQSSGGGVYTLRTYAYRVAGLPPCSGEPFANQPVTAFCTGFMVKGDLIATAGHCLHPTDLPYVRFVFGFDMENATTANLSFTEDQIYTGVEVVARRLSWDYDYAIVRVNREIVAPGASPLPLRAEGAIAVGERVGVIGHPAGLPKKIAFGENTVVRENNNPAYLVANLDTYGGNSGSPVFNATSGLVEGILVRGEQDYVLEQNCFRSNVLPDDGGWGEDVSKSVTFASIVYDEYYPPPPNNNCDKAITIREDIVTEGSTQGATGASGTTSCGYDNGASVWYVWIPSRSGEARISLCGFTDFDTSLAVYSVCFGQELACNDDYCGNASEVKLQVIAGRAYYIRIAGNNNTTGNFDLLATFSEEIEGEGETVEGEGEGEGEGEHENEGEGESPSEGELEGEGEHEGEGELEGEGEHEGEGEVAGEGESEGEDVVLVLVPNVANLLRDIARDVLLSAGFSVGDVTLQYSSTVGINRVIAQDPAAGAYAPMGARVNLTVSQGAAPDEEGESPDDQPETVRVPNVKGMALDAARRMLENVGLAVGAISYQYTTSVPENQVINQQPEGGIRVDRGTRVDLTVATRTPPENEGEGEGETVMEPGCDCNGGGKRIPHRLFNDWLLLGVALLSVIVWSKVMVDK